MSRRTRAPIRAAILGPVLVLAGIVSYFVIAIRFGGWLPGLRNSGLPSWLLIGFGVALSLLAARRALAEPPGTARRWIAPSLAAASVLLAGRFGWLMFVGWAVPPAAGPVVGAPAPDFALVDQDGRTRRLADFRGSPLLLVFYRGHW